MFGSRNRLHERSPRRGSFTQILVNVATIASTAVTCVRLAYYNIVSIQVAVLIMLGVVVFVALGNNIAKIVLAAAAVFLFVLLYSYGNRQAFAYLLAQMLTLIFILVGLYIIIKGFFRR